MKLVASLLLLAAGVSTASWFLLRDPDAETQYQRWLAQVPPVDPDTLKELVRGNNEFALEMYRRLSANEGNLVFSPLSISSALAMTYAGARGQTAEQMAEVLHFKLGQERLHPAYASLAAKVCGKNPDGRSHIFVANALWAQRDFALDQGFVQSMERHYGGAVRPVDFVGNPDHARLSINRWVRERTRHRIDELLNAGDVHSATRLVLTNAIYFKAPWHSPFPTDATMDADFAVASGKSATIPMMYLSRGRFNYAKVRDCHFLELPYRSTHLTMVVILPIARGGLPIIEADLNWSWMMAGVARMTPHEGDVALPRFKFATRCNLHDELARMGMRDAFSASADFSGITNDHALRLDRVVHEVHISVDEQGTEAVASTASSMTASLPPPFSFRADHPFLFLILDRSAGVIIFLGRVSAP